MRKNRNKILQVACCNYKEIIEASKKEDAVSELYNYIIFNSFKDFSNKLKSIVNEENIIEWLPMLISMFRIAAKKVLNIDLYDSQIRGGLVIFSGNIAELTTGEGKTIAAVLPAFLNCILGYKVHIITVNDYLAKRDCEWMKPVYEFLGVSCGHIEYEFETFERKEIYKKDVVYASNNEVGFDYLRDNMMTDIQCVVQNNLDVCIIDEIDSVLIDEARIPLIISDTTNEYKSNYKVVDNVVRKAISGEKELFVVDKEDKKVLVHDIGWEYFLSNIGIKIEDYVIKQMVMASLYSHYFYSKDVEYIVEDGRIVVIDEFTGRPMYGRKYKGGLHQAIAAKEGMMIDGESGILATITFQKYFSKYKLIGGMTGTAKSEENEFNDLYDMRVVCVDSEFENNRVDLEDRLFDTEKNKYKEIINIVKSYYKQGNPILIGTKTIEKSELISVMLSSEDIKHSILNAKNCEQEAGIVKKAGIKGSVVVATNMAGRGTDIIIDEDSIGLGGLVVIGVEKNDSLRIDNQLKGRAGRQGLPGITMIFSSLEDDLFFDGETKLPQFNVDNNGEIKSKFANLFVNNIQKKIENNNFGTRQKIYLVDDIFDVYREEAYSFRKRMLLEEGVWDFIVDIANDSESKDKIVENFKEKKLSMGETDFIKMSQIIFFSVFDNYWKHFLMYMDKMWSVGFSDKDEFIKECKTSYDNMIGYVKHDFLFLMLNNNKIGDIILNIDYFKEMCNEPKQRSKPVQQEIWG